LKKCLDDAIEDCIHDNQWQIFLLIIKFVNKYILKKRAVFILCKFLSWFSLIFSRRWFDFRWFLWCLHFSLNSRNRSLI
jgi:hypothetical protein